MFYFLMCAAVVWLYEITFSRPRNSPTLWTFPEVPEQKWHPESGSYPLDAVEKSCTWHGTFFRTSFSVPPWPTPSFLVMVIQVELPPLIPLPPCAAWSFGNSKIWTTWSNKSKAPRMIWWACSFFNAFQTKRRMKTVYQRGLSSINTMKWAKRWRMLTEKNQVWSTK